MADRPQSGIPGGASPICVVLCSRDRPQLVRRALASLVAQSPPAAELLVVDNAPSDERTRDLVRAVFPAVRYAREAVPGLDFARNRALRETAQEIVAFLDDDAVADPGWSAALMRTFATEPRVAIVTGRVEPLALETEAQRLFEANGGFSRGTAPIRLPRDARAPLHGRRAPLVAWAVSVGSGCSYAVRRRVALELGGFDEALDLGSPLPGGGDHDLLWRALEAGYEVAYEPSALAWHEHRPELADIHAQLAGHQRAVVAFLVKHTLGTVGRRRLPLLAFLAWRLVKPGARLARRLLGRDPLPASVLLHMWGSCWSGLAAYAEGRRIAYERRIAATLRRASRAEERTAAADADVRGETVS
jgi:GT2 family glycosyltransferase